MDSTDAAGATPRVLLDRYRIERTLGRGGMGEVLLARDELLQRRVALKRVIPRGDDRATVRRNVLREARRASRISDRHVIQIFDVVELPDEVMLVLEYVDGVTLRERLEQRMSPEEFWRLAPQCAAGVAAAHAHGVIHRDIKPENFIVTPAGEVKVLDFGIARRTDPGIDVTTASTTRSDSSWGGLAGTPAYMAPEVLLGERVDERADLFALGVVFYEMLAGRRPFEGEQFAAVANQILHAPPPPVREANPEVSPSLSNLVSAMLAKKPAERVESALVLKGLLTAAHDDPENAALREAGERGARSAITIPGRGKPRPTERSFFHTPGGIALMLAALAPAVFVMWRAFTVPRLPAEINVAVLPPETPGATEDFASFALGAMSTVHSRLQRYVDRPEFQVAAFSDLLEEKARTAADAHQSLGTNVALFATLTQTPDRFRAVLELREPKRERVLSSKRIDLPIQQPYLYLDRLYRETAAMLHQPVLGNAGEAELGMRGAGTLRFYLQGVGRKMLARDSAATRRAVADFDAAVRTEPGSAVTVAGLAAALFALQQATGDARWLTASDSLARRAESLDSTRAEGYRVRAAVLTLEKQPQAAIREIARAAALRPFDDDIVLRLARSWAHAGDAGREKAVYLDAIRRRPHDWRPYWWLATWERRVGNVDECIRRTEQMVEHSPDYSLGYSNLGGLLVLRGDYARGIDSLTRSIALRPGANAYSNLGIAYFNSGRYAEAIDAFNQCFQFEGTDYATWMNLGDAYWFAQKRTEASNAYAQAVRLGREDGLARLRKGAMDDPTITANLSTLFARVGERDSAIAYRARAIARDSSSWRVQYAVALTTWELGNHQTAMRWLERSIRGGYPVVWLRDSPVFREWRDLEEFRALIGGSLEQDRSTTGGG